MRVVIAAIGTRGDVQPLVALGVGLKKAGHEVRVTTSKEFETLVREQGLDAFPISSSATEIMQSPEMRAAMGGSRNPLATVSAIYRTIKPIFAQSIAELLEACHDADVVVASLLGFYGAVNVAEKLNIPCIEAYVLPGRPTRAYPSPIIGRDLRLGGTVNLLSNIILQQLAWWLLQPPINQARKSVLNLPSISFRRYFRNASRPVLYGFSQHVLPRPSDWNDHQQVTGYWFLDHVQEWQPPAPLTDFLAAGDPPVYIGFGSMTGQDPERITSIVLASLRRSGQRGILMTGWGALQPEDVPENILVVESVPHDWLFERVAAVAHHGGAGTTAAGLRAGVPSIIVPFGGDQYLWGRRIRELGVGPTPIPVRKLTVEQLTQAIITATTDVDIRQRAQALAKHIRAEDGISQAVTILERAVV